MKRQYGAVLVSVTLALWLPACKEGYETHGLNPDYRYDILTRHTDFQFDPGKVAPVGSTAEDLDRAYPVGPTVKWTFRAPLQKTLNGHSFAVDRTVSYVQYIYERGTVASPAGPALVQHMIESINITFFMHNGRVVYINVEDMIPLQGDEWKPGRYDTDGLVEPRDSYPGYRDDMEIYWKTRADKEQVFKYALSRANKQEKWGHAADPPPGYWTFAQRFGFIPNYL